MLEEAIGGEFEVDMSKITEGISQQKNVMRLLIGTTQPNKRGVSTDAQAHTDV